MTQTNGVHLDIRQFRCGNCDGAGIIIGPYDPNLGENEVRECQSCHGWGILLGKLRAALRKWKRSPHR